MINVDDRILSMLEDKELFLLLHIVKRLNKDGTCWPSNETLLADAGWKDIRTLRKVKSTLEQKGIIRQEHRTKETGGQTSNAYRVMTDMVGVYKPANQLQPGSAKNDTPVVQKMHRGGVHSMHRGGVQKMHHEVLSNEVLSNEANIECAKAPRPRFQKPTVEEITSYLEDLFSEEKWRPQFSENPPEMSVRFFDHYESNGWKVGRNNAMKDWQASCRNWLRQNKQFNRNGNGKAEKPSNGKLVSEETQRRVLAELIHEFGNQSGAI